MFAAHADVVVSILDCFSSFPLITFALVFCTFTYLALGYYYYYYLLTLQAH
jgi:hypothetical protein